MSEAPVKPDESGNAPVQPPVSYTQADLDRVAAAARKEVQDKFNAAQSRLEKLEREAKEREDAELSEVERLKKEKLAADEKINGLTSEVDKYHKQEEKRKEVLLAKVEKEADGLTDEQKMLVEQMPLDGKLGLIAQLKQERPGSGDWGKGVKPNIPGSLDAVAQAEKDYGRNSPQFRKAFEDYQLTKRR